VQGFWRALHSKLPAMEMLTLPADCWHCACGKAVVAPAGMPDPVSARSDSLVMQHKQAMPGGGNKFSVRRDPVTQLYVALSNPQTPQAGSKDQRNVLHLVDVTSLDLLTW